MTDRLPLVVDSQNLNIKELPVGDNLDLGQSGLINVGNITMNACSTVSVYTSTNYISNIGMTTTYANLNLSAFNYFTAIANATTTFQFENVAQGSVASSFVLELSNGGNHTITWPTSVRWPANTAPVLSAGVNKTDLFVFITDDNGSIWRAAFQLDYPTT
jgi:hypothetical protein